MLLYVITFDWMYILYYYVFVEIEREGHDNMPKGPGWVLFLLLF